MPLRFVSSAFLAIVAVAVAECAQIVGVLLVFTLMVGPAAAAMNLTRRLGAGDRALGGAGARRSLGRPDARLSTPTGRPASGSPRSPAWCSSGRRRGGSPNRAGSEKMNAAPAQSSCARLRSRPSKPFRSWPLRLPSRLRRMAFARTKSPSRLPKIISSTSSLGARATVAAAARRGGGDARAGDRPGRRPGRADRPRARGARRRARRRSTAISTRRLRDLMPDPFVLRDMEAATERLDGGGRAARAGRDLRRLRRRRRLQRGPRSANIWKPAAARRSSTFPTGSPRGTAPTSRRWPPSPPRARASSSPSIAAR